MVDDRDITNEDILGAIIALKKSVDDRFDKVDGELQAVRDVVDNELASQGQVTQLDGRMLDVERAVRQQTKKLDRINERLHRAKV